MKKDFIMSAFLTVFCITVCNSQITDNLSSHKCSLYNQALIGNMNSYSTNLIINRYFCLKETLINSNNKQASLEALELYKLFKRTHINNFSQEEHKVSLKLISRDAKRIAHTSKLKKQRFYFITLSKNIYKLQKRFKTENPIYYMFCPMAVHKKGGTWLSQDNSIRNPYYGYGHQMLNCGIIIEVIN